MSPSSVESSRQARRGKPAAGDPTTVGRSFLCDPVVVFCALIVAVLLAYAPALNSGFIWDDDDYVTNNATLRSMQGLGDIWFKLGATPQYYPIVHTVFWMECRLYGLHPFGFHLVNALLHATSAFLLWCLLRRLAIPGALLAASVFALHPVGVESVAWITERKNVLSLLFYLSAALLYLPILVDAPMRRHGLRYGGALTCFILALLSKTVACSLPAALLVILWWKTGTLNRRAVLRLLPFFVIGVSLGLLTAWMEKWSVGAKGVEFGLSPVDRCLIAGRALWFYAWKLLLPLNLVFIYPKWRIDSHTAWQYLFPLAAVAAFATLWFLRARIGRGPLAAVLIFAGTLVPALGFFNVFPMQYSYVADHFQYHACIALIVLFAAGAAWVFRGTPRKVQFSAAIVLLFGLGGLSFVQAGTYHDLETLWRTTIERNPQALMARNNLANVLIERGEIAEAIQQYALALQADPKDETVHFNYGVTLHRLGDLNGALRELRTVTQLDPNNGMAHFQLGNVLAKQQQPREAIEELTIAAKLKPDFADAHVNLATQLAESGDKKGAASHLTQALRISPDSTKVHYNLAALLVEVGDKAGAAEHFNEVLRRQPGDTVCRFHLANALADLGKTNDAIDQYKLVIQYEPRYSDAYYNLGRAHEKLGQLPQAQQAYQSAVDLNPNDKEARQRLENLLKK